MTTRFFFRLTVPITRLEMSMPEAQMVSEMPRTVLSANPRIIGPKSVWIKPKKNVMAEDRITSTRTPFFCVMAFQPSENSLVKDFVSIACFDWIPFRTTSVAVTVKKKVAVSKRSRRRISEMVSSRPASTGEIRYFADPATPTRPLAFVYCSGVSKSVTVAL